eukprot:Opistho-2@5554
MNYNYSQPPVAGGYGGGPAYGGYGNPNQYTRVTYTANPNFVQRVGNSMCGFIFGLLVLTAAFPLLFWNEGRAVQTAEALDEGLHACVPIGWSQEGFNVGAYDGRLVHTVARLSSNKGVEDVDFAVKIGAIRLERTVEMYQWTEHVSTRRINEGQHTREEKTYTYKTEWSSTVIDSKYFDTSYGHENPRALPIPSKSFTARDARIGPFSSSDSLLQKIADWQPLLLNSGIKSLLPHSLQHFNVVDGYLVTGDPRFPVVGDVRVNFKYAGTTAPPSEAAVVSVIALTHSGRLMPYVTRGGRDIELLSPGEVTMVDMFDKEHTQNNITTWILRAVGWFVMFLGISMTTSIVYTIVDWIPIVRSLVGLGLSTFNFILSVCLSLFVIAAGWIRYRPIIGAALLAVALVPILLQHSRSAKSPPYPNKGAGFPMPETPAEKR